MSWVVEDWTSGLSGGALKKVRDLEAQLEQLKREKLQRQMKLDSTEAALSKQRAKHEEVRSELVVVRRDLQSSQEEAQTGLRARERLSQELQVKQAQVCGLEGQLDAARTLTQSLSQEVKRLEAELEKLQKGNTPGDSTLFSTPCWSGPSSHSSSRWEKDRNRGEGDAKALHVRQLQFSACIPKPASPRQPDATTPLHRPLRQSNSSTPSAVFPWEREHSPPIPKGKPASSPLPNDDVIDYQSQEGCGMQEDLRKENDVLAQRSMILELQTRGQSLEQEVRSAADRHRDLQDQLLAREQLLSRAIEELARANACLEKEGSRVQAAEQKVKQLQEELNCQRQNAESSRCSAERHRKELERQHQRELLEQQKESQSAERQHQQETNKLKQEIQQAHALHNALQTQCDKVLLQKQAVQKDLDSVKGQLQWTEKELKECQRAEVQTKSKLTEALRERDALSVSLEQSERKVKGLEEIVMQLTQELNEALRLISELRAQLVIAVAPAIPVRSSPAGDCSSSLSVPHRDLPPRPLLTHRKKEAPARQEITRAGTQEETVSRGDREPGEGIDSDYIRESVCGTEKREGEGERVSGGAGGGDDGHEKGVEVEWEASREEQAICTATLSVANMGREVQTSASEAERPGCAGECDDGSSGHAGGHGGGPPQDFCRENAALRDELHDLQRELQLRLDDLEAQRRAEAEARTRLKQASRKHSTQAEQLRREARDLKEEAGKLERQLEEERVSSSKLQEALAAMELMVRQWEEKEKEEEEEKKVEREEERTECTRLREEMAALESELRREREEREQEEVGRRALEQESRRALTERLAELEAELKELREKEEWENRKPVVGETLFSPLLFKHNNNQNFNNSSNVAIEGEGIPLSPEERAASLSESVSPHGMELWEGDQAKLPYSDEAVLLVLEVERLREACESLRVERDEQAGRTRQAQARLEALQSQVTSQTTQLTLAFENQSSHIEDLLRELRDRDSALQMLEGELRSCREEMSREEMSRVMVEKLELGLQVGNGGNRELTGTVELQSVSDLVPTAGPPGRAEETSPELLRPSTAADAKEEERDDHGTVLQSSAKLGAEDEELRSTLATAAPLKELEHTSEEQHGLIEESATHCLLVELKAAQRELNQLKSENAEIKSKLEAAVSATQEQQPSDSKVQQGLQDDSGDGAPNGLMGELQPGQRDLCQIELDENEHLTSKLKTTVTESNKQQNLLFTEVMKRNRGEDREGGSSEMEGLPSPNPENKVEKSEQQVLNHADGQRSRLEERDAAPSGTETRPGTQPSARAVSSSAAAESTGEVLPVSPGPLEDPSEGWELSLSSRRDGIPNSDTEQGAGETDSASLGQQSAGGAQDYSNTVATLWAENQKLRSWALSICPPEREGELSAIAEGLQQRIIDGLRNGCGRWPPSAIERMNTTDSHSKRPVQEGLTEQRGQNDVAIERPLNPSPDQEDMPGCKETQLSQSRDEAAPWWLSAQDNEDQRQESQHLTLLTASPTEREKERGGNGNSPTWSLSEAPQSDKGQTEGTANAGDRSGSEKDRRSSSHVKLLQLQLEELQSQISGLAEENERQREELGIWRTTGETITPTVWGETTVHVREGSIVVVREDHLLLSCRGRQPAEPSPGSGEQDDLPGTATAADGVHQEISGNANGSTMSPGATERPPMAIQLSVPVDGDSLRDSQTQAVAFELFDDGHRTTGSLNADVRPQTSKTEEHRDNTKGIHYIETGSQAEATEPADGENRTSASGYKAKQSKATTGRAAKDRGDIVMMECHTKVINCEEPKMSEPAEGILTQVVSGTGEAGSGASASEQIHTTSLTEECLTSTVSGGKGRDPEGVSVRVVTSTGTQTDSGTGPVALSCIRAVTHASTQTDLGTGPVVPSPHITWGTTHTATQTEEAGGNFEEERTDSPPLSPAPVSEAGVASLFSGSFPIPSDPARLADRIRRNRGRMSAAFDDTEYEPYGLPEVVMKGFADIPSGPACPYVLRRGLLGTEALPLSLREQGGRKEEDDSDP